jgi:hypothetical protein
MPFKKEGLKFDPLWHARLSYSLIHIVLVNTTDVFQCIPETDVNQLIMLDHKVGMNSCMHRICQTLL